MRSELSQLHNRLQTTIIYVTHDQTEAMTMGDRIVVMKDGLIHQVGAPLEIYESPVNMFVAGFIGSPSMNFVPARLLYEGTELFLDAEPIKVRIPRQKCEQIKRIGDYVGQDVVFGIRPEDIDDAALASTADPESVVNVMVEVLEPIGNESYLHCRAGEHTFVARVEAHTAAKDGLPHSVAFDMDKMHLFDKETEKAIR
jgi:multiple sugar transport system ATP-binding protein